MKCTYFDPIMPNENIYKKKIAQHIEHQLALKWPINGGLIHNKLEQQLVNDWLINGF